MQIKTRPIFNVTLSILCAFALSGCARDISPGLYTSAHVGEASATYLGSIISVRQVQVQEGEKLQENILGGVLGGVAGGVLGHQLGGGRGKTLATLGGAAVGALGGALAQRELSKQVGLEYTVKLDDGRILTIVQGTDQALASGQRVKVIIGQKGRSRVVAI